LNSGVEFVLIETLGSLWGTFYSIFNYEFSFKLTFFSILDPLAEDYNLIFKFRF
jgi:hypothetical protein